MILIQKFKIWGSSKYTEDGYLIDQHPIFYLETRIVPFCDGCPFVLSCRERPKFQAKEDGESPRNGIKPFGEASGTVKVTRDSGVEDTLRVRLAESFFFFVFLGLHISHFCTHWLSCTY